MGKSVNNPTQVVVEKEGLLSLAIMLISLGAAVVQEKLTAGFIIMAVGIVLLLLRGKLKINSRWPTDGKRRN